FPPVFGARFAKLMFLLGKLAPPIGCSGGAVVTELFWNDGSTRLGSVSSPTQGQRMAAMPCVYVVERLCAGGTPPPPTQCGAMTAYNLLGAEALLARMKADGFVVQTDG